MYLQNRLQNLHILQYANNIFALFRCLYAKEKRQLSEAASFLKIFKLELNDAEVPKSNGNTCNEDEEQKR